MGTSSIRLHRDRLIDPEPHQLDRDDLAVTLGVDAHAGAVLRLAVPGHHEEARRSGRHGRAVLARRGVGIDPELGALRRAGVGEALAEDPVAVAVLAGIAGPGDDEVADPVRGHRGTPLIARRVAVDLELRALRRSRRGEPLPEDAEQGSVLLLAGPDHDEAADDGPGDARLVLIVGGVRVDPELRACRYAAGEIALAEDA